VIDPIACFRTVYVFLGPLAHAIAEGDLRKAESSLHMVIYFSNMIMSAIEEGEQE
jgi:hypothetical protein